MANAKRRPDVPSKIEDEIHFASRRGCCLCETTYTEVQIHHIDGDNTNNDWDNLVGLCLQDHSEAGKRGGLGRALKPSTIKLFRDRWYATIAAEREEARKARIGASVVPEVQSETTLRPLDTLTVYEIRKARIQLVEEPDWSVKVRVLKPFTHLFDQFADYGPTVAGEMLSAAYDLGSYPRAGLTLDAASTAAELASGALPIVSLVGKRIKPVEDYERELFKRAAAIGWAMVYDSAKYLQDLAILDRGGRLLHDILRFAELNDEAEIKMEVMEHFHRAEAEATAADFAAGARWLQYLRLDALAVSTHGMRPPSDLEALIEADREKVPDNVVRHG